MSTAKPKTPKRRSERRARGRKGRGNNYPDMERLTEHRCGLCNKRRPDKWGKPPRRKYGVPGSPNPALHFLHPSCKALYPEVAA